MSRNAFRLALATTLAASVAAVSAAPKQKPRMPANVYLMCEGDRKSMDTRTNDGQPEDQGKVYHEFKIAPTTLYEVSSTGDDYDYAKPFKLRPSDKITHKLERGERHVKFRMTHTWDGTLSTESEKTLVTATVEIGIDRVTGVYTVRETTDSAGYRSWYHVNSEVGTCEMIDVSARQF